MQEDDEIESAVPIHELLAVRNDRLSKLFLTIAAVALIVGIGLAAVGYVENRRAHSEWNPLGPYTLPQRVTNGPVIKWDSTVNVTSMKCSKAAVTVHGASSWEAVGAVGANVLSAVGVADFPQGCVIKRFEHLIPAEVIRLAKAGITTWELAGTDTPYRTDGSQGVSHSWTTETFRLRAP